MPLHLRNHIGQTKRVLLGLQAFLRIDWDFISTLLAKCPRVIF